MLRFYVQFHFLQPKPSAPIARNCDSSLVFTCWANMPSQLLVATNKLDRSLFWHTFQNRILIYIPHFFFSLNPNSWKWIPKNYLAESLWNIHCCCCCVITHRAEADDYLWHAINTHNHPNAGKSHGCDAPPLPPASLQPGYDNDWWPLGLKLSSALHRWQVSGDSLSRPLPRQLITIWGRVGG